MIKKCEILPGCEHHCRKQLTSPRLNKYMLSDVYKFKWASIVGAPGCIGMDIIISVVPGLAA